MGVCIGVARLLSGGRGWVGGCGGGGRGGARGGGVCIRRIDFEDLKSWNVAFTSLNLG